MARKQTASPDAQVDSPGLGNLQAAQEDIGAQAATALNSTRSEAFAEFVRVPAPPEFLVPLESLGAGFSIRDEAARIATDPVLVASLRALVADLVSADSHRQRQETAQKITEILDTL